MKRTVFPIAQFCLAATICLVQPAFAQFTPMGGGGLSSAADLLHLPYDLRIGSGKATPEQIRALEQDIGVGSGLYGSCTPTMSAGDRAAVELVKIGPPAVDSLIAIVESYREIPVSGVGVSEAENRRWFAVQILGHIGDKRALAVLAQCLREEPSPAVRVFAPSELERLNDARSEDALLIGLQDAYPDIQARSAHALGALHSVRAVPGLIALLGAPARNPALNNGGMAGPNPVSPASAAALACAQIGGPSLQPLRSALKSRDLQIRRMAALGIAENVSPHADGDIRMLLRDPDAVIRASAAHGERERKDPLAVPLLASALKDSSADVRASAAIALARSGGMPGVRALIAAANGNNPSAAACTIEPLRDIWDPRAVDVLLGELLHGRGLARLSAAESLLRFSDPRAIAPTLSLLSDPDPAVRKTAVWLTNQIHSDHAFAALLKSLDDPDADVRIEATEALESRHSVAIVAPLIRRLTDPVEFVRLYAIYGLGFKGDRDAVAALTARLGHDTPRAEGAVHRALEIIAGTRAGW